MLLIICLIFKGLESSKDTLLPWKSNAKMTNNFRGPNSKTHKILKLRQLTLTELEARITFKATPNEKYRQVMYE